MAKIFIVDDHPIMRKGLALTLEGETGLQVVGQAEDAEAALEMVEEHKPDLVIVDISLPDMSGLELIKHLSAVHPEIKTLVVSRHDEILYAERAIRAGAKGYVMTLVAGDAIVKAVRRILKGGIYVSEDINERLLMGMASGRKTSSVRQNRRIVSSAHKDETEPSDGRRRDAACRSVGGERTSRLTSDSTKSDDSRAIGSPNCLVIVPVLCYLPPPFECTVAVHPALFSTR